MPELWNHTTAAQATGGTAHGNWQAQRVEIDSRKMQPGDLFVAIKGELHDGHAFIAKAKEAGAVAAIVSQPPDCEIPYILVKDTLEALTQMARYRRAHSKAKYIGVTGSVGKTSSKEMLRLALGVHGTTYATSGNYNNHIGLPLCMDNMPEDTQYAVMEMGMNHAGEITHLSNIVQPHVALITNVEAVHLEFFDSESGIADAKAEIFDGMQPGGIAILNQDNRHYAKLAAKAEGKGLTIRSCGSNKQADCRLVAVGDTITITLQGQDYSYHLPVLGQHMAANSLMVLAAVQALGLDVQQSAAALANYSEPAGRGSMQLLPIEGGQFTLIDDSYNASPASMRAAFAKTQQHWQQQGKKGKKIAILGDMLELGNDAKALHESLAQDVAVFDLVFAAGELIYSLYATLPDDKKAAHARDAQALLPLVTTVLGPDDVVLVKGSHGSKMHQLAASLIQNYTQPEDVHAV